ncbi:AfsR/SARP family transcriptional regulator [Winogradskyella ursingii]|uniref:AfsR/SARP family transcriptional regulator n=1 Tax=Winogradskyella ursingii TaxID=2686079 RepID=UPI0015CCA0BF|nr:BTAD domain-containing putative transcriptional regulator [Winogradskyella ursingii]
MSQLKDKLQELKKFQEDASIRIQTLGQFNLWRENQKVEAKQWGRDKTVQLLQYLISNRQRHALHRERIMEHLWEEGDDRDFKVALHGVNKVLEPNRPSRTDASFVIRQGVSYQLDLEKIWIDVEALEQYVIIGNEAFGEDVTISKAAYRSAIALYQGVYLPNRIFEDWSSEEREKTQILILGAYVILAEIILNENPLESIRLAQCAIAIDKTWEDAYRLQMQAYIIKGNRPQAIKTYQKCADVLEEEYGIDPLPATKNLLKEIESI